MRPQSRRAGFTLLEIIGVLAIIGIAAGMAVYRVNYWRYRMDGNARLVQNFIIAAQQVAVRKNVQVQVMLDGSAHRLRRIEDYNGNGLMDTGDTAMYRPLQEGARFASPATTVDGATAAILTGPGARETGNALQRAFLISPAGQLLPATGSGAGDVVIYLGSPRELATDARAVGVIGATGRTVFYSNVTGAWRKLN
jgi:prepilin-type N-terminal cleavage/methylation domain-containing protein